jgi:hypothetical protein
MKTKFLWFALTVSAATIAQANPVIYRGGGGSFHRGTVARAAPAAHARARVGGFSSMRSMATRSFGGRTISPSQRYSSVAMRPSRPVVFRRPNMYPRRVTYTRSGPFTAATINQANRFPRFAHHRNTTATTVWNQRNNGSQFRNGNNRLRPDWNKHVFAQRSDDWHRDWDRHGDHWWNGHRCCFINGTWVIFNIGFDPWWPYSYYPSDYFYPAGSPYYGYDYPYSYDYNPGYDDGGDYEGQMYYDQNSYPDQSQSSYDSMVYQNEVDSDQNGDATVIAAQERLAREGYYHGETDGMFSSEMQKAVRSYQITNGLRATGYLDTQTLAVMGLQKSESY